MAATSGNFIQHIKITSTINNTIDTVLAKTHAKSIYFTKRSCGDWEINSIEFNFATASICGRRPGKK